MEEMVMMMSISTTTSPENSPSWKLYQNPYYNSHQHQQHQPQQQQQQQCQSSSTNKQHQQQQVHHCLHLPLSARKLAASFWDLTFFKPVMESEMDYTRAQIIEMKDELEYERKARKKLESSNKRLAKELGEERRAREALERVCEELAREISYGKSEVLRMKKELEEERKMLRMAEVLREERVQMKFAEAKIIFEEKLLELEGSKQMQDVHVASFSARNDSNSGDHNNNDTASNVSVSTTTSRTVLLGEKATAASASSASGGAFTSTAIQKRASTEAENPHIKRGIKGFVEFPRVVRAIGSKSRNWGTKLECQKTQLRIMLRQKNPIRSNHLIIS